MHAIEPYYNWRNLYAAEEDENSPFFGNEYSEFYFTDHIYDHAIHPQWDNIGSTTLFIKILFVDYVEGLAIIELMGEWNDTLYNDVMTFKRDAVELLIENGVNKFVLIGENVLNFHSSDDCYYEEWFDEVEDGWIALINFRDHVLQEFKNCNIDQFFLLGGKLNDLSWRTRLPEEVFKITNDLVVKRIGGIV